MSQNPVLPNHQGVPVPQYAGSTVKPVQQYGNPHFLNHSNGPSQNDVRQPQPPHFLANNSHLNSVSLDSSRNASPVMNSSPRPSVSYVNRPNQQPPNPYPPAQQMPPQFMPPGPSAGFPQQQINANMPPLMPPRQPLPFTQQPTSAPMQFGNPQPPSAMLPPTQPQNSMMPPPQPTNSMMLPPQPMNSMIPPPQPTNSMMPHSQLTNSMLPPTQPTNSMLPPAQPMNSMMPPPQPTNSMLPSPLPGTMLNQQRYAPPPVQNMPRPQYPMPVQPLQQPGPAQQPPFAQPHQFNNQQALEQQMGRMTVANAGFNQMWGQQAYDLLQCRHILPPEKVEAPEVKLGQLFSQSVNCSPDIFRCTVNKMPETNSLLQKSRLPLGILIHPFRDLYNLPVIQCNSIVRCRSCRTYINPFVYFIDSKRWKCNLCYRVNDLPDDFQYDPVSHSYGDPTKRPEVKSATIEFIAPSEYMLRPPPPAVYLFLMDVSYIARESGYLQIVCDTLLAQLEQLPGDSRKQVAFICYDSALHFYCLGEGLTRPREMTILDIDDVFLPMPDSLLVNLGEQKSLVQDILKELPKRHRANPAAPHASALGAALQAAYKLMAPTGGRVTVFQTCLPNIGPGALTSREDPNARSGKEVQHLNPATDFYKRLALDCSGSQIAVDLFLLNSQYSDLSTLSGISKFCGGTVHHIPLFKASRPSQAQQLKRLLYRYLTRKVGFEAVMRIRCTRGIAIHTFHGNFFVRSTDLLALPNVSPDSGFGMQLAIEESLADLQQVCFQAALLYTSSKGERRIRVHTMCLPICNTLVDILNSADQQCIIGLLSKMAVDRSVSASLGDAREALTNVAVDSLSAYKLATGASVSPGLPAPKSLSLLPLYLHALLRHPAFRTGQSTRLDDRVAAMCAMKSLPLYQLMRSVYPDLYPIHSLRDHLPKPQPDRGPDEAEENWPDPPRLHLSAERVNSNGAYLLDDGELMTIYIGHAVDQFYLKETFGVNHPQEIPEDWRELPEIETEPNQLLHAFVDKLNDDRPYASEVLIIKDSSPNRTAFTERLLDDRVESALSYYEFLQHIKTQIK